MATPNNVTAKRVGTKIVIEVDASPAAIRRAVPSATGKTKLLASSAGTMPVEGLPGVNVALNVMLPLDSSHLEKMAPPNKRSA
jgi:hypothetical protein